LESSAASRPSLGRLWVYLCLLYSGHLLAVIGLAFLLDGADQIIVFVVTTIGLNLLVAAMVYLMILLYRVWRHVICESSASGLQPSIASPGKAVGFLFIPLFNLYWVFVAIGRLPEDLNTLAAARQVSGTVNPLLGYATAVLLVVSAIPVIPFVSLIAPLVVSLVLMPIFVIRVVKLCEQIETQQIADRELRSVSDTSRMLASIKNWPDLFQAGGAIIAVGLAFPVEYLISFLVFEIWDLLWLLSRGVIDSVLPAGIHVLAKALFFAIVGGAFVIVNLRIRKVWLLPLVWGLTYIVLGILSNVTLGPLSELLLELDRAGDALMPSIGRLARRGLWGIFFMTSLVLATRLWGLRIWSLAAGLVAAELLWWAVWQGPGFVGAQLEYGIDMYYLAYDMLDVAKDAADEAILGFALYFGFLLHARTKVSANY
jgi:hypothetical protein